MTADTTVARTILTQLGGRRFCVMTGARNFLATADSLIFALPQNEKKIFKVVVRLTPMDLYTVEFWQKNTCAPSALENDVHCDKLQEVFTEHTGFYTCL